MAVSLRQAASNCLGQSGSISVTRNVFGYVYGLPTLPIRLKEHLDLIKGRAFNLSVIFVGHASGFTGTTSRADADRITYSIQRMREIYAQANLGVRKIYWTHIPEADVGAYTTITDKNEAENLTEDWSANNDGIDVFFVQNILNAGGWSDKDGTCDKSDKGMSGAVLEVSGSDAFTGVLLAHEVGHYLGLGTGSSSTNVMGVDSNNDGIDEISSASINLTSSQGTTMRSHCSTKGGC
jgi:hypothetical protein